jgi:cyclic pyranopterin phosphate synthase
VYLSEGNEPSSKFQTQPVQTKPIQKEFSHLDHTGKAKMVNVGQKARIKRIALARGEIAIGANVLERLLNGSFDTKGDVLSVAKVAGIMGAKATSNLIPMCHQIPLDHIEIDIEPRQADGTLVVHAKVEAEHKTGVELECLSAVSITLLTIYDMCKSAGRDMVISNVRLVYKRKLDSSTPAGAAFD